MLIEFTIGNYRSFGDPITLSLEAAAIKSEESSVDENNIIPISKNLNLLTSAAIYGANASGKSNLVHALVFMRELVINSARESQAEEPIKFEPFRLRTSNINKPGYFEVVFLIENQRYRYGFEVTSEKIVREWLFFTPSIREARLFTRENNQIEVNPHYFREGLKLEKRTRDNALFLSVSAQFNGEIALKVMKWFHNFKIISGLNDIGYRGYTIKIYQRDPARKEQITNLVHTFDMGIEEIAIDKVDRSNMPLPKDMPDQLKKFILETEGDIFSTKTYHTQFDETGQPIDRVIFDLDQNESEGTKKIFYLSGPILDVLSSGKILVIDEMEARMHPLITKNIINMFNLIETNPKRAQLIFITHDTNLLDRKLFRRDQIWFTEKDSYGSSHLYSLVEFKPRNDESYERNYLRGKYGAIPYLGDLSQINIEEKPLTAKENKGDA